MTTMPRPGNTFILSVNARHHAITRPLIGLEGRVTAVHNNGAIVSVRYPKGDEIHVPTTMGRVVPLGTTPDVIYIGPARRYEVTLPLPPVCASPNARVAPIAKAEKIRIYRQNCALEYSAARIPTLRTPVKISLAFYLCRQKDLVRIGSGTYHPDLFAYPRDLDNARACAKAAQDALQDVGVIASDGARHVQMGDTIIYSKREEHQGRTCLVLTIEEIAE